MKRLYEWITKANQVLLFFLIIAIAILMSYFFYDTYQRRQVFEPPSVAIAQSPEEAKKSAINDVTFLGESSGVYVFGLKKRIITVEQWRKQSSTFLGSEDTALPAEIVNVVFSRGDQPLKTLLPHDGLVVANDVFAKYDSQKIKASLFRCVTEDTDGNHKLDENDRTDLYVVAEALDRPDLVMKGVIGYRMISATHLIAKTDESKVIRFWDIDIQTQAKKEIPWK